MTEWFPCCIKQLLLCQHLSWMLRMFSWCIHESCFAATIACIAASSETSSWLLISRILLFSLVARRGCPCLTNQLAFKAGDKMTSSSHCSVKSQRELGREEGAMGGAAPAWQQRSCFSAAGMEAVLPYKWPGATVGSSRKQEEKGQRKGIPRMWQSMSERS